MCQADVDLLISPMYPASKHTAAVDNRGVMLPAEPIAACTKHDKGKCFLIDGLRKRRKMVRGNKERWKLRNVAEVAEGGAQDFDVDIEFIRVKRLGRLCRLWTSVPGS